MLRGKVLLSEYGENVRENLRTKRGKANICVETLIYGGGCQHRNNNIHDPDVYSRSRPSQSTNNKLQGFNRPVEFGF